VRLSLFWPDRPAVWFAEAETQFQLAAITRQRTKFIYVVSQFTQKQAAEVEEIVTSPPKQEPYDRLKAELVHRLSTSREQRVRQLLSHEEMGDRKPSQFLRHLKSLGPDVPDNFLRTIWASRLPPHVQAILAGQTEVSLDSASHLADRICDVTPLPTCEVRQHSRATRVNRGALAPGCLTAGIPSTQPPAFGSAPPLAQMAATTLQQLSAAPRNLLVPMAVRGCSSKLLPTVLPPAEGYPTAEKLPPVGKLHRRKLVAANVCTTKSGRLFFMDRNSKRRYLLQTVSDLCVFHVGSSRGAGSAQTTPHTLQMGPQSDPMDGPQGA